ncbi:hypothetical protein RN629_18095, partial [Sphingomonadaceae bacterium jetA1]|uniref:hypothetical protein n=1 Tax=Facivitalis istanbulensis TaxID=3075838 RepID=UPI00347377BD
ITRDPLPLLVRQRPSAQGLAPSPTLNQNSRLMEILQMQTHPRVSAAVYTDSRANLTEALGLRDGAQVGAMDVNINVSTPTSTPLSLT